MISTLKGEPVSFHTWKSIHKSEKPNQHSLNRRWMAMSEYRSISTRLWILWHLPPSLLIPKRLGEGVYLTPHCRLSKNVSSREEGKPCFIMTFNIILSHIFPENFIEIPHPVQKIWRLFSTIFWIFWDLLVTKKLMTSAYNKWYQHFFTFNLS